MRSDDRPTWRVEVRKCPARGPRTVDRFLKNMAKNMTTTTQETTASALQAQAGKYLSFNLGQESYGIPVLKVREIIRLINITPIPQMPAFIRGVINLRGKIVPVVDLRARLS